MIEFIKKIYLLSKFKIHNKKIFTKKNQIKILVEFNHWNNHHTNSYIAEALSKAYDAEKVNLNQALTNLDLSYNFFRKLNELGKFFHKNFGVYKSFGVNNLLDQL